ncbi:expressed unknown protein [Seminavis robusta]|uniref:EGF-like domain-containing protein n=1 Tax=Seminavis robusta TaxID=568900 RepID=A0A9N8EGD3_9STRA|nr:expressed unknown protein [Seminavis robusta]|eukprot:Sro952_g224020.1 n/a (1340) ;mRNA; f:10501-14909
MASSSFTTAFTTQEGEYQPTGTGTNPRRSLHRYQSAALRRNTIRLPSRHSITKLNPDGVVEEEEEEEEEVEAPVTPRETINEENDRDWTPVQANFPLEEDEAYPFLDSITAMRAIKGYVHDENLIPTTTYSFLVSTSLGNMTNIVNALVLTLQVASYIAVSVSVLDFRNDDEYNPFKFPPNVTSSVRATQLLSLVYSILVQESIVNALYTFRNGFDEEELRRSFPECATHGLKARWYICLCFILTMGCYAQFLTFVMIMQSEDVLGVLLNYAAVNFIATIDDRFFYLGKRGWLGKQVERNVRLIGLADNPNPPPIWYRRLFHSLFMLVLFAGLIGMWGLVVSLQTTGAYLPNTIRVEFDDQVHPALGTFSGYYDIQHSGEGGMFRSAHAMYYERRSQQALFSYCPQIGAWTFQWGVSVNEFDPCNWHARSSATIEFDITTTATSKWFAKNPGGRTVPMPFIDIHGWSCTEDEKLCGLHGTCEQGACQCEEGFFGDECEFPRPCNTLEVDGRMGDFRGIDRKWSEQFELLRFGNETAIVYDRPVYITQTDSLRLSQPQQQGEFDMIFFTGRRWALAFSRAFQDPEFAEDLESYLARFHAHFSNFKAGFLSEPVGDIKSNPSPEGLVWYSSEPSKPSTGPGIQAAAPQQSQGVLLCTECNNNTNPCLYDGICLEGHSNTCNCSQGSAGGLCEVPPIGNGRCDTFFNTVGFDRDGGDCCRGTCISTAEAICGRDPSGFLDTGFFNCQSDDPIPSETVRGEPFAEAGRQFALSGTGSVMAAVMNDGELGLFDQVGAQWIQREMLGTCLVTAITMATGPFSSNPIFQPPAVIVVSCKGITSLRAYFCTDDGCSIHTLEGPPEAYSDLFGDSLGISTNGDVIAVSSRGAPYQGGFVEIFRAGRDSRGSVAWERNNETIIPEKYRYDEEDNFAVPVVFTLGLSNASFPMSAAGPINGSIDSTQAPSLGPDKEFILSTLPVPSTAPSSEPTEQPSASFEPSAFPSSEPSIEPSAFPTASPNQLILAMSLSGSGDTLALVLSDVSALQIVTVLVYQFNGTDWTTRGHPIEDTLCSDNHPRTDMIELSEDGSTLLYSTGDEVHVVDWNAEADEWARREADVLQSEVDLLRDPERNCSIDSVTLSPEGNIVALNIRVPSDENNIATFAWTNSTWERREEIMVRGSPEGPLALSQGGSELAVGLPLVAADLSGSIQTYEYPPLPCQSDEIYFRLTFTIKPEVTRWTLETASPDGEIFNFGGGPYYFPNFPGAKEASETHHDKATVIEDLCLPTVALDCGILMIYPTEFGGFSVISSDGGPPINVPPRDIPAALTYGNCTNQSLVQPYSNDL